ncbi:Basic proline-rich protein precursor [Desulfosporosinus metallidurans]|uniref:Basic proline-rich protein n=1 Tax=Desulfosporosinus metallidurans TaxID=1888891 RepID=A0A1Q8QBM4_9FIRM|nr:Basic proline-rich protein precursor [Desulfosporosinus metallidurans]
MPQSANRCGRPGPGAPHRPGRRRPAGPLCLFCRAVRRLSRRLDPHRPSVERPGRGPVHAPDPRCRLAGPGWHGRRRSGPAHPASTPAHAPKRHRRLCGRPQAANAKRPFQQRPGLFAKPRAPHHAAGRPGGKSPLPRRRGPAVAAGPPGRRLFYRQPARCPGPGNPVPDDPGRHPPGHPPAPLPPRPGRPGPGQALADGLFALDEAVARRATGRAFQFPGGKTARLAPGFVVFFPATGRSARTGITIDRAGRRG